MIFEVYRIEIE